VCVYTCVCVCVCVCVRACVCEYLAGKLYPLVMIASPVAHPCDFTHAFCRSVPPVERIRSHNPVCVCVCVCV